MNVGQLITRLHEFNQDLVVTINGDGDELWELYEINFYEEDEWTAISDGKLTKMQGSCVNL